jgi:hypothetical protein
VGRDLALGEQELRGERRREMSGEVCDGKNKVHEWVDFCPRFDQLQTFISNLCHPLQTSEQVLRGRGEGIIFSFLSIMLHSVLAVKCACLSISIL